MPRTPPLLRRIILVVLDGLRADAIDRHALPHLDRLRSRGAWTLRGRTVQPSITAAAMTSLFTGASPAVHGIRSDRFAIPRRPIPPMSTLLAARGIPTFGYMARVSWTTRLLATRIARHLGATTSFEGRGAREILAAARPILASGQDGLMVFHWPDADIAGHAAGWHSPDYAQAARGLDTALGDLVTEAGAGDDPETLLMVCADHGGGGQVPDDHESDHPDDVTIPILLAGQTVSRGELAGPVSLLDVPATILWAFGVERPGTVEGVPLVEAFIGSALAGSRSAA